jgi:hypothetical protein
MGAGLAWRRNRGSEVDDEVHLVDYQKDLYKQVDDTDPLYADVLKNMPIGATPWSSEQKWETEKKHLCRDEWHPMCSLCTHAKIGYEKVRTPAKRGYHRAGTAVLRYKGYDYLCGFDEGSYFVSKLPMQVNSVEGAYLVLTPKAVMGQEFLRQGEWFFVQAPQDVLEGLVTQGRKELADEVFEFLMTRHPILPTMNASLARGYRIEANRAAAMYLDAEGDGMGPKFTWTGFKRISEHMALPRVNSRSNPHSVTYLYMHNGFLLAGGTVTHPQHKRLKLGNKQVFMVFKNNSLADWSAQGNVD